MSDVTAGSARERVGHALGSLWWLPLFRGVLMIILGTYAAFKPGVSMGLFTQAIGAFLVANGVLSIMAGIMGAVPSRGWVIVRGILEILVGIFAFANPVLVAGVTVTFMVCTIALAAIVFGILEIIAAIQDRKAIEGEGWLILGGAVMVLFGVLLLMSPLTSGVAMVRVLGVFGVFAGISLIGYAFRLRGIGQRLRDHSLHRTPAAGY